MSLKSQVSQEDAEPIYLVILVKNMHTVFLLFVGLNDCESQVKWRKNIFTSFLKFHLVSIWRWSMGSKGMKILLAAWPSPLWPKRWSCPFMYPKNNHVKMEKFRRYFVPWADTVRKSQEWLGQNGEINDVFRTMSRIPEPRPLFVTFICIGINLDCHPARDNLWTKWLI